MQVAENVNASAPYVAQLANGGSVVVWNAGGDFYERAVYAQILDANGQKAGAPITVFYHVSTNGWGVRGVAALPDGSFIVAAKGEILPGNPITERLYVQKVSSTGQLLATGGNSDPAVNGGLASYLVSEDQSLVIDYSDVQFFVNADGSYSLTTVRISHPTPTSTYRELIFNIDASGNVTSNTDVSDGFVSYPSAVITRLRGGNFLIAGTSTITYGPVVWKILTSTGQVVAQQSLGAAPGNGTSDPRVASLADGTGLLTWRFANSTTTGWSAERIDGAGTVSPQAAQPSRAGSVTGLAHGGYVQTWMAGTQVMAQYFTTTGQPAGDPFVAADLGSNTGSFSIAPTNDGFAVAYTQATANGPVLLEMRFTAPALQ